MPKQKTDDLIQLISSLSRAEKRHFRLFVKRNQNSDDILFLQLFDFLDKKKEYDEVLILKKLPGIKKRQLSNLKAHLYKQLLVSLRLLNANSVNDIQIREMIDFAQVLYDKGLYRQALESLSRAKARAGNGGYHALQLEILEFEKHIEGQYITRSIEGRADQLTNESNHLVKLIDHSSQFSNLSLQLYGLYLKRGYVRNAEDFEATNTFFQDNLPRIDYHDLDFVGKLHYCQSYIWKHFITQDFAWCYRYAQRWVDLFHQHPEMRGLYPALYLKGLHHLLNALFNVLNFDKFVQTLDELLRFPESYAITEVRNINGLFHLYKYIHAIKRHFMDGTFSEGTALIPGLMEIINQDPFNWDHHRVMVFYYRIACLYFGSGDNDSAITYLNKIINQKNPDYRADIQAFSRILNLIAHYELGNSQLVEYQIKSVYRFLSKMEDLGAVQREIFRFLRRVPRMQESQMKEEFINLKEKLENLEHDPYEKRPFLYLDIISWLESKIEGRTVQEVIRSNFLARQKDTARPQKSP